jgi:crotonobetainyl-CoA:carnitine CoA-transferase CaiB-like acyl-CoA transferase
MNVGHFEQISDCWSLEGQPATYYRTAAARARILQADATTPGVRQYLDKMIAHCELLAGNVEPGVSPRSDRRYAGRTRLAGS